MTYLSLESYHLLKESETLSLFGCSLCLLRRKCFLLAQNYTKIDSISYVSGDIVDTTRNGQKTTFFFEELITFGGGAEDVYTIKIINATSKH